MRGAGQLIERSGPSQYGWPQLELLHLAGRVRGIASRSSTEVGAL
jgi:hypothetical protein